MFLFIYFHVASLLFFLKVPVCLLFQLATDIPGSVLEGKAGSSKYSVPQLIKYVGEELCDCPCDPAGGDALGLQWLLRKCFA